MTSQNKNSSALLKIVTFNDILSPLMLEISKNIGLLNLKNNCDVDTLLLAKLVDNTIALSNKYISENDIKDEEEKWNISCNFSRIVASYYHSKKDVIDLNTDLSKFFMEKKNKVKVYKDEEEVKNAILESIGDIVNSIKRFNFAIEEEKLISGVEKQIIMYANNLFEFVNKKELGENYYNYLYVKTINTLTKLFNACYYAEIDATLSIPINKREEFIQKHMLDRKDSIEKIFDGFFNRTSILSNISVSIK